MNTILVDVFRLSAKENFICWKCTTVLVDHFNIYKRIGIGGVQLLIDTVQNSSYIRDLSPQSLRVLEYYYIEGVDADNIVIAVSNMVTIESNKEADMQLTFKQFLNVYNIQPLQMPPEFVNEKPVGLINGINKVFTLSSVPIVNTLKVRLNGQVFDMLNGEENQFTLVGKDITLLYQIPVEGDNLYTEYFRVVYI